jgi:hypothetical protein
VRTLACIVICASNHLQWFQFAQLEMNVFSLGSYWNPEVRFFPQRSSRAFYCAFSNSRPQTPVFNDATRALLHSCVSIINLNSRSPCNDSSLRGPSVSTPVTWPLYTFAADGLTLFCSELLKHELIFVGVFGMYAQRSFIQQHSFYSTILVRPDIWFCLH